MAWAESQLSFLRGINILTQESHSTSCSARAIWCGAKRMPEPADIGLKQCGLEHGVCSAGPNASKQTQMGSQSPIRMHMQTVHSKTALHTAANGTHPTHTLPAGRICQGA